MKIVDKYDNDCASLAKALGRTLNEAKEIMDAVQLLKSRGYTAEDVVRAMESKTKTT
jgi:hypothetical protein